MIYTATQPQYLARLHVWNRLVMTDRFVLSDDVDFDRHHWQHRTALIDGTNQQTGTRLLTLPVKHGGSRRIAEKELGDGWQEEHLEVLRRTYRDAPFLADTIEFLEPLMFAARNSLKAATVGLFFAVAEWIGVHTCGRVFLASELLVGCEAHKTDRLIALGEILKSDGYLTGRVALNEYLNEEKMTDSGIAVSVQDWTPPIAENPSIVHLMMTVPQREIWAMLGGTS